MTASILAIVPNDGMRNMLRNVAQKMEELQLQTFVGSLTDNNWIADSIDSKYDMIISCGSMVGLIREKCSIPVVDMGISGYDMLRTMMLAQFGGHKSAIVGSPAICASAETVKNLFQYEVEFFTVNSEDETRQRLLDMKEDRYALVIGDLFTCSLADQLGLNSVQIAPGVETIQKALERAMELVTVTRHYRDKAELLESVLVNMEQVAFVFSPEGKLMFSNGDTPAKLAIQTRLQQDKSLWQLPDKEPRLETFGTSLWQLRKVTLGSRIAFFIRAFPGIPVGAQRGITILSNLEPEHIATENYMAHSKIMSVVLEQACRYSRFNFPVVLIGERGVGKDTLAYIMKNHCRQKFAATIMINCILIDEESWLDLLNDTNSILFQLNVMFYYRNFQLVSPLIKEKIVKHINRMRMQDNSFHIIAINSDSTVSEENCLLPSALDTLQCNTLFIPSLRARQSDIPQLVALYVNELNSQMGTQTASIEPKAISLLQGFPWPGNLYQFKRVLTELMSMTDSFVITEENVRFVLQQETSSMVISNASTLVNMNGSLADIEKRIIHFVLQEENMNQTRTAARLDISRATLWRKLREER